MGHRGPDASGHREFDLCSLAHTRLRILDISEAGDQPMANEDESVWVVFNGEIYNHAELRSDLEARGHRFRSRSDTEVLVHLYELHGVAMSRHLRGMFAYAIWDTTARRLVLSRDRLGIKPLYLRHGSDGRLAFASEMRALIRPGDGIDEASLMSYLRLGWVPGPATLVAGISELPAAHTLVWQDQRAETSHYWSLTDDADAAPPDRDELGAALSEATARHLVADVPVGIFLSSGVDSVAVAALAADRAPGIHAYTVGFDTGPDEVLAAASVARELGMDHTAIRISGSEILDNVARIVADMDQPTVDGVNSWVVSRAVREAGATVALSGLGGDELFCGYSTFRHVPRMVAAASAAALLPDAVRQLPTWLAARFDATRHSRRRRAAEAVADGGWGPAYAAVRGLFGRSEAAAIRTPPAWAPSQPMILGAEGDKPGGVARVGRLELANYLPFQLLRDTDAMSMAHGLEVRVPLLDDQVVALATAARSSGSPWSKRDLITAVDPSLAHLADRPKQTFTLPFDAWLKGPLRPTALEALSSLGESDLGFDRRRLTELWTSWDNGRAGWRPIWGLIVLSLWLDRHLRDRDMATPDVPVPVSR